MGSAERRSRVRTWLLGGAGLIAVAMAFAAPAQAAPTLVKVGELVNPTFATGAPGDSSRVFVTEKWGTLRVIRDGVVLERPFLDLISSVSATFERGLLSVVFSPDYATSGRFFLAMTANGAASTTSEGEIQVREYRRSATDPDVADPATGRILLTIEHTDSAHNGGQLQIGPDGKLWLSTGDGGLGENSQDPALLLGRLIRIDQDAATPVPEVVAKGLRNPWRFSFDRATGQLVVADVGESQVEEINVGLAANYGWPCFEGSMFRIQFPACDTGTAKPVLEKTRADGFCSIIGGYVVRDPGLPTLLGRYLYSDFCNAVVRAVDLANVATDAPAGIVPADGSTQNLTSFGEDTCGRLLVTSLQGSVYRIVDGAPSPCLEPPAPPDPPKDTPPPPPPPQPPVRDTRACKVSASVSGLKSVRKLQRLTVTLKTDEACRATVSGKLSGVATFKTVRQNLVPGKSSVVRLKLTASGTRALRRTLGRRSSVKAALKVQAVDGAGNIRTLNRSATVRG